ncbi:MAG TPA: carboxypeptidase regulatory-like domain-containing protein, partial [Beijerinckiaceae bacterium]
LKASDIPDMAMDPAYAQAMRTTVTSSGGAFRFDDVAPGAYILSGQKIWREPGAFAPQGGAMYARVTVEGAERRKVILVGR